MSKDMRNEIPEDFHSKYSPSSGKRLINCPASWKLSEGLPDKSSRYATEGTAAHDHAAEVLVNEFTDLDTDRFPNLDSYVNHCFALMAESRGMAWVEKRVFVDDDLHGTADFICLVARHLHVVDLKYGFKIVSPKKNEQLMYYALGAIKTFNLTDVDKVTLTIAQPKNKESKITSWTCDVEDILNFESALRAAVERAENGNEQPKTGSWCDYCKAVAVCPARKLEMRQMLELSDKIDDADFSWVLEHKDKIIDYIHEVELLALEQPPKGWKVSEGVPRRAWRKDVEIPIHFLTKKPMTLAQADKAGFDTTEFVEIKIGAPRLVRDHSDQLDNDC